MTWLSNEEIRDIINFTLDTNRCPIDLKQVTREKTYLSTIYRCSIDGILLNNYGGIRTIPFSYENKISNRAKAMGKSVIEYLNYKKDILRQAGVQIKNDGLSTVWQDEDTSLLPTLQRNKSEIVLMGGVLLVILVASYYKNKGVVK